MQRTLTLGIGAFATVLLVLFSIHPNIGSATSLAWRKLFHGSTGIMGSYKAPLSGCDVPETEKVPNQYLVFLHATYSFDQHKQAVGDQVDFETAIMHLFDDSSLPSVYYAAHLDDPALAAVRSDIGVDVVSCNRIPHKFGWKVDMELQ